MVLVRWLKCNDGMVQYYFSYPSFYQSCSQVYMLVVSCPADTVPLRHILTSQGLQGHRHSILSVHLGGEDQFEIANEMMEDVKNLSPKKSKINLNLILLALNDH